MDVNKDVVNSKQTSNQSGSNIEVTDYDDDKVRSNLIIYKYK
jgi:hypothetical protein